MIARGRFPMRNVVLLVEGEGSEGRKEGRREGKK